jgi:hypothetical protein
MPLRLTEEAVYLLADFLTESKVKQDSTSLTLTAQEVYPRGTSQQTALSMRSPCQALLYSRVEHFDKQVAWQTPRSQ